MLLWFVWFVAVFAEGALLLFGEGCWLLLAALVKEKREERCRGRLMEVRRGVEGCEQHCWG